MKPFIELTSQAIPLPMKDIDTDMIIPAQYLTQISKDGYGKSLFARLKSSDPEFPFNLKKYEDAQILLSLSNFGCGSSREHAVWALQQAGIQVIIASSFSDIFAANASKNGLLLIALDDDVVKTFIQYADHNRCDITVNLEEQTVYCHCNKNTYHFDYDPFRKECLLKGQDDLDYLIEHETMIDAFKSNQITFNK